MEYIASGVVALLLGMKFTAYTSDKQKKDMAALVERVEKAEKKINDTEGIVFAKTLKTIQPVAVAVKRLNEEVGL